MEAFWTTPNDIVGRIDAEYYRSEFVLAASRVQTNCETRAFSRLWKEYNRIYIGIAGFENVDDESAYTPYLRPVDISLDGQIQYESLPWCHLHWLDDWAKVGCAKPGDLVIEVKGNTRKAAVVDERIPANCIVSGSSYRIQLKPGLDPYFYQAFFTSETGQLLKRRVTSNTTINYIDPDSFKRFSVPVVDETIQRAIGNKVRKAERLRELAAESRTWAACQIDISYESLPVENGFHQYGWRPKADVDALRIDPWFHRPFYVEMADRLSIIDGLKPIASICKLVNTPANLGAWKQASFDYFEIGGITSATGEAVASNVVVSDAPSRAKYLVRAGDVLVSTVRPNLRAVGQIDPDRSSPGVATSGFCILRPRSPEIGAYVRACLVHDAGVHQLMRWNTGGTYPAIDHDVPGRVLIPFGEETATEVGGQLLQALRNTREATRLLDRSSAGFEA